ncbi:helix-turn-helix domain-containing protein [Virgibacillus sp. CBA3643]|uniref:helix-turn-helix domain-containing protein n=1 Tax=Virgibacillus sp. CBA3643 TaxID=2942278 RepID=UPI0035A3ADB5
MYGERLKYLRKERHWTIEDVSEKIGVGHSTYAGYEREYRKPPIETLSAFAELYGVSTDYILGLTDEKEPKKIEYNASEYLKKENLNWDGVPLTDEELKPIRDLMEVVIRDRMPNKKKET